MDAKALMPSFEAAPADPLLFWVLGVVSFMIHIILVNAFLGGSMILLASRIRTRETGGPPLLSDPLTGRVPVIIALAINFGVVPLLFIQVIYGHLYYTSSVLMGLFVILIIPLLIIAYYSAYVHKVRYSNRGVSLAALCVLIAVAVYIAFVFINNLRMMVAPDLWPGYFSNRNGTMLPDIGWAFMARMAHFLFASLAVGGLATALFWEYRPGNDRDARGPFVTKGLRIFAGATALQAGAGIWYFFSQSDRVINALAGGEWVYTAVFGAAIACAVAAVISALRGNARVTTLFLLATMTGMCFTRAHVRIIEISPFFGLSELNVKPQYAPLALFLMVLVSGIVALVYMIKKAVGGYTEGGRP